MLFFRIIFKRKNNLRKEYMVPLLNSISAMTDALETQVSASKKSEFNTLVSKVIALFKNDIIPTLRVATTEQKPEKLFSLVAPLLLNDELKQLLGGNYIAQEQDATATLNLLITQLNNTNLTEEESYAVIKLIAEIDK